MTTAPIHTTATTPIEFIPPIQDVESYLRDRGRALDKRVEALKRREAAWNIRRREGRADAEPDNPDTAAEGAEIAAERALLADERETIDAHAVHMRERYPTPQIFILSIPTSVERDSINSRLVQLGLTQVSQEMMRATTIDELFYRDWSDPLAPLPVGIARDGSADNETVAEMHANFLDSVWQRQEAHDAAIQQWQEQEIERVIDEAEGAPRRPRLETPPKIITMREQSQMHLLVDYMMKNSQRLRNLAAEAADFARKNGILLVRMHLMGVKGFDPKVPIERDRHTRAISEEAALALRETIDDTSWLQLVGHIDGLYRLDGGEEKNSDSPPEKPSLPGGSPEQSGDSASNGGSSTGSSSTPALAVESEKTIDKSSGSTSASDTAPALTLVSGSPTADR